MRLSHLLKNEIKKPSEGVYLPNFYRAKGYVDTEGLSDPMARAKAIYSLFTLPTPHIHKHDLIAGSILSLFVNADDDEIERVKRVN